VDGCFFVKKFFGRARLQIKKQLIKCEAELEFFLCLFAVCEVALVSIYEEHNSDRNVGDRAYAMSHLSAVVPLVAATDADQCSPGIALAVVQPAINYLRPVLVLRFFFVSCITVCCMHA